MSTWVSLDPLSVVVAPGDRAESELRIRNTGDVVEEYHVDVVGGPGRWCTADPPSVRLYPGTTGTVRLAFSPPRGPDPEAGPHPYGVRVRPVEAPEAVTVTEGSVSVAPFTDLRAELLPVIVRGWRRARPRLVVDNYGNTLVTASVQAAVQDQSVDFETRTPSFQVPPGRAFLSVFTGRPSRLLWFGKKVRHPFTATIVPSGSATQTVPGTYEQTALLPSWMSRLLAALLALAVAFIALWLLAKPSVATRASAEPSSSSSAQPMTAGAPTGAAKAGPSGAGHSAKGGSAKAGSAKGGAKTSASSPASAGGGGGPAAGGGSAAKRSPAGPADFWPLTGGASAHAASAADTAGQHPLTGNSATMWCTNGGCAWFNDGKEAVFRSSGPVVATGPGQSFTVSAYVYIDHLPANKASASAVSQDGGANGNSAFSLRYLGSKGCWAFTRGASQVLGRTGGYQGKWTYLTGVYNAKTGRTLLYVNGKRTGSVVSKSTDASSGPLAVGRAELGGKTAAWWGGGVKNVEVFPRPLSPVQVQALDQQYAR